MRIKNVKINDIMLLVLVFFSTVLGYFNHPIAKYSVIGLCLLEVGLIFINRKTYYGLFKKEIAIWIMWSIWLIFNLIQNFSAAFMSVCIQQILLIMLIFNNYKKEGREIAMLKSKRYEKLLYVFILFDCLYYMKYGYSFFSVPILGLSFFGIYNAQNKRRYIFVLAVIMFLLKARSTVLALVCMIVVSFFAEIFKKHRYSYNLFFWIVSLMVIIIPRLYVWFYQSNYGMSANLLVRRYTGKNLFSGREELWIEAYELIENHKWFGYGGEYFNNLYSDLSASVHNLYLFLRLEGGYFILVLFVLIMFLIWTKIGKYMDEDIKVMASSYIIAIMIRISFDVTFLANNFGQSVVLWLPIVFILNRCANNYVSMRMK